MGLIFDSSTPFWAKIAIVIAVVGFVVWVILVVSAAYLQPIVRDRNHASQDKS